MNSSTSQTVAWRLALLSLLPILSISCASPLSRPYKAPNEPVIVLEFQHSQSKQTSDCLAMCADMVLDYYGVEQFVSDTLLPLDLTTLSRCMNTDVPVNSEGQVLFSAILELTPDEVAAQIEKYRPVIIAFQPANSKEYHSIVVTGTDLQRERFFVNDPASRKPGWRKISKIPTFADSEKFLVMLIGLRES